MKKTKDIFKVGDIVKYNKKIYVVSGTTGWIHKGGWISLVRELGVISNLARVEEVLLVTHRENIKKNFWEIFPDGEK